MRIKKGDNVQVLSGNDKGKTGEVLEINQKESKVIVKGVNVRKKENQHLFGFLVACTEKAVLSYPKCRHLSDKTGFSVDYYCVGGKAVIEVRTGGEDGPLLGVVRADAPTDSYEWYCRRNDFFRFDSKLDDTSDLFLVLKPEKGAELCIDSFHFIK